jgi:hypothetical protein
MKRQVLHDSTYLSVQKEKIHRTESSLVVVRGLREGTIWSDGKGYAVSFGGDGCTTVCITVKEVYTVNGWYVNYTSVKLFRKKGMLMTLRHYCHARCLKIPATARGALDLGQSHGTGDGLHCSYLFTCCSLRVAFMAERFF